MCDKKAISIEHAPPKCLFPPRDSGKDCRKNLITVPSCNLHNSEKSKDDEYLRFIIAISITSKGVGVNSFIKKFLNSENMSSNIANFLKGKNLPILCRDQITGQLSKSYACTINRDRFDNSIKCITRAIYFDYHDKQKKLTVPLSVFTDSFMTFDGKNPAIENTNIQTLGKKLDTFFEKFTISKNDINSDIFEYHLAEYEDKVLVKMIFYKGFKVYVTN